MYRGGRKMSKTMEYAPINNSSTIAVQAGTELESVGGRAINLTAGKGTLPTAAGEMVVGIALLTQDEKVLKDEDITVQIKDIGMWKAGAAVDKGDCLTADEEGYCQKATTGQYIFARALSIETEKEDIVKVQIINAGFAK